MEKEKIEERIDELEQKHIKAVDNLIEFLRRG